MSQVNSPVNQITTTTPSSTSSTTPTSSTITTNTASTDQQQFRNPHDKKGRSTSCLLCQKRKQKCDHRLPSCTTCIKAGVKCIQPAKYNVKVPEKDEYTIMLEKKIKFLEKILDANNIVIDSQNGNSKKNFKYKKLSPFLGNVQGNGINGGINGLSPTPAGISSGESLPQPNSPSLVDNKIIPIPTNRKLPIPTDDVGKKSYLSIDSIDYSNSLFAKYNLKEFLNFDPVFEFDEKLSRAFLDIHFTRLQFKYPLLDEEEIFEFHNAYVTNNLSGYMNNNDHFHYCCCRMWMIFAISSCLHMTTGKYSGPPPARYFSTAIRHITKVGTMNKYQKIEILTLAVLYLIRTDRDSVCLYEIIKDSLRLCVEMGLNKKATYLLLTPEDRIKKMRLWWCVYLLERMITIAVGKGYSLEEYQVDTDIPLFEFEPSKAKHPSNTIFINQSIKLRRIESRFVEKFHIVGNEKDEQYIHKEQLPHVESFFQELEIWRGNCEGFSNGIENETLRLYYYRSVRLLIQPFLELMDPMDKLFRECQAAAGQICQLFKVFHEKTVFGHSTTAIHTVFVAGVTLVYCLWLARNKDDMKRRALGDVSKHTRPTVSESLFNGLNDLRACSICLYVMTERSKFALIFRDTFDQIMTSTITNLIERCGPDSSELIYNPNEPGMPPAIVRRNFSQDHPNVPSITGANAIISDEEKLEQAERKRKQGQLQKNVVPKSLSHLLINSPPLKAESPKLPLPLPSPSDFPTPLQGLSSSNPLKRQKMDEDLTSLSSLQYSIYNQSPSSQHSQFSAPQSVSSATSTNNTQSNQQQQQQLQQQQLQQQQLQQQSQQQLQQSQQQQQPQQQNGQLPGPSHGQYYPIELTPFNGRTNTMINNISVWTGESGGPPISTASLFDYNNKNNSRSILNSGNGQNGNGANGGNGNGNGNGNGSGPNLETYLWNVPVEEFWTNNDDYGFLA